MIPSLREVSTTAYNRIKAFPPLSFFLRSIKQIYDLIKQYFTVRIFCCTFGETNGDDGRIIENFRVLGLKDFAGFKGGKFSIFVS